MWGYAYKTALGKLLRAENLAAIRRMRRNTPEFSIDVNTYISRRCKNPVWTRRHDMRRKVADGHSRKCWIHQSEAMYGKAGDTEWGGSSVSLIMNRLAGSRFQTTESDSASLWQVRSDAFSVEKRCDTLRSERIIQLTPCISPPSVDRCLCGMRLSLLSAHRLPDSVLGLCHIA